MSEIPRIITADCSGPREIDDGLFVDRLDEDRELYRVGVCVADTSNLYRHPEVVKTAFDRTTARYWDLPDGERGYDPMIEPSLIKSLEFTAGTERDALIVSFNIGPKDAPADIDISFGPVRVMANLSYKDFANRAVYGKSGRFLRASQFIVQHLDYVAYGDHAGNQPAWRSAQPGVGNVSSKAWKNGSKMNESFMVAANHLVGLTIREEGRPFIYRVHDPEDERYLELLSPTMALFSRTPGQHSGLRLDPYPRVTSPLRRLDDFVNNHQLKQRDLGRDPTAADAKEVAFGIRRLNQEVIAAAPKEASRYSRRDILGRGSAAVALQAATA